METNENQLVGYKSYFDILRTYLTSNHLGDIIVIICTDNSLAQDEDYKWLIANIPSPKKDEESVFSDYLFLEFEDGNEAVSFCNSVPHMFYSCVWEKNKISHENC